MDTNLSQWKQQNHIPPRPNHSTTTTHITNTRNTTQLRIPNTYSCLCGLPDQQHNNNICPPLGKAIRKISLWTITWIKYSTLTNNILYYQI